MKKNYAKVAIICLLFGNAVLLNAQVTIGSGLPPAKGALLQLKTQAPDSENVTSTQGGLLMPRVRLNDLNALTPFVANTDPDLAQLKISNTGLLVYNLTENESFVRGLYIWNGEKWIDEEETDVFAGVRSGLHLSEKAVNLGGTLLWNTEINQAGNDMRFTTGAGGEWRINESDVIVFGNNNVAIGTDNVPENTRFVVGGNTNIDDALTVTNTTHLQQSTVFRAPFRYNYDGGNHAGLFLQAKDDYGTAVWALPVIGEMAVVQGAATGGSIHPSFAFATNASSSGVNQFPAASQHIYLPPGRWLVMFTMIMRPATASASSHQKAWITLGFSRRLSAHNATTGTIVRAAHDRFRDRYNTSWPAYIEAVLNRNFSFSNTSGIVVIDNTADWQGHLPADEREFANNSFANRIIGSTGNQTFENFTQAHADQGRPAFSRFDFTVINNTVGRRPEGHISWNWPTNIAFQLSNNASENVIVAIRLD